jgi:radical SAM enzyme (rSAM/lipoprotein system)
MGLKSFLQRKLLPIYQNSERELHELSYIFFELTNNCNLECIHCGSDCIKDSTIPNLPSEKVLETLSQIKTKYNPSKITVVLSGGEPLVYPNVFKLGARITELGFPWGMVTNGYAWNKKRIQEAKEAGMRSVTVSLDGLEDDHNWLRGKPDSYKRAVNAIKLLVANPFYRVMDVITCINKRTIKTINQIFEQVKNLGVKRWRIFTIAPIGRAVNTPELFLNRDEHLYLFDKIMEYRQKGEISVNYAEADYLGKEYEKKVRDDYYFCMAGIKIAGVMVNGDMLACPNIDRRFKQGNIYEDSFIDVWENKYQVFRNRKWMKKGQCEKCKEWDYCQGNSFHLWDLDNDCTKICHYDFIHNNNR